MPQVIRAMFNPSAYNSGTDVTASELSNFSVPAAMSIQSVSSKNVLRTFSTRGNGFNMFNGITIGWQAFSGNEFYVHFTALTVDNNAYIMINNTTMNGSNNDPQLRFQILGSTWTLFSTSVTVNITYPASLTVKFTRSGNTITRIDVYRDGSTIPVASQTGSVAAGANLHISAPITGTSIGAVSYAYYRDLVIYTGDYAGILECRSIPVFAELSADSVVAAGTNRVLNLNQKTTGNSANINRQVRAGKDLFTFDTSALQSTDEVLAINSKIRLRSLNRTDTFQYLRKAADDSWNNNFSGTRDTNVATHYSLLNQLNGQPITKELLDSMVVGYQAAP